MKKNKRIHNPDFKANIAMTALRGKYSIKEIASNFDINPSLVHAWRQLLANCANELFSHGKESADADQPSQKVLDRKLEELRAEQEWMRRVLSTLSLREKRECVETESEEVSILGQSRLLGLHRSGVYYKSVRDRKKRVEESEFSEEQPGGVTERDEALDESREAARSL